MVLQHLQTLEVVAVVVVPKYLKVEMVVLVDQD
jgi:hypothetical protein